MTTSPSPWASNTTLTDIAAWLRTKSRICVLTHVKPDGDAVGTTIALVRTLRRIAAQAGRDPGSIVALYTGNLPLWIGDLARPDEYIAGSDPRPPADTDAFVITDTGSWMQLDALAPLVRARAADAAVIDHHLDGAPEVAPRRWIETTASAAAVPVAELCRILLGVDSPRDLPADIAEPLYYGCATDTGWFRFPNTNAQILALAADLQRAGADHARLYTVSEQQQRAGRVLIIGRALAGMTLHHDDQLAIARITLDDIKATGAAPGDTGGFGDVMLSIKSVRIAVILTESNPAPLVKVSLRSKSGPHGADVNAIARTLGGGGHAQAAGAKIEASIDEAARRIIDACAEALA